MLQTRTALVGLAIVTLSVAALTGCSTAASSKSSSSTASSASSKSSASSTSGGSSSSSTVARPTNLCSLLSAAEAESVFGDSYGTPYESENYCGFTGDTEKFDLNLSPTEVNWNTAVSIAKVQYDKLTPVSGVGDQAVEAPNFLQFRKGSLVFSIEDPDGDGNNSDKYIALAKIVLSHLG